MNITEVIENAKNLTGSDAATARQIGVVSGRIAEWKSGVRTPTPEQAAALADFIGVPWWVVVAASEAAAAERRGDIPKARQWRERIGQVTAPVILAAVLGIFGIGHPNEAGAAQKSMTWRGLSTIYIMGLSKLSVVRGWLRHRFRFAAVASRPSSRRTPQGDPHRAVT